VLAALGESEVLQLEPAAGFRILALCQPLVEVLEVTSMAAETMVCQEAQVEAGLEVVPEQAAQEHLGKAMQAVLGT
jgi:hypothetical protein